jgi:hypothetical protein
MTEALALSHHLYADEARRVTHLERAVDIEADQEGHEVRS